LRKTADEVASALGGGTLLIDARPHEQFEGKVSAAARKGHLPGAKSVPYAELFDEDWRMKDAEGLTAAFAAAGVDPKDPRPVIAYCNGGVTACAVRTALAVLGRDDVAIYDGSWNEWGNDPSRPIE
jgi:thiosulfate/3-mercaptopyruvate sulfurtransferase